MKMFPQQIIEIILQKCFTRTLSTQSVDSIDTEVTRPKRRAEKLSAAMKAFLKRSKEHGKWVW